MDRDGALFCDRHSAVQTLVSTVYPPFCRERGTLAKVGRGAIAVNPPFGFPNLDLFGIVRFRYGLRDRQAAAKVATSSVRQVFTTKFGKAKAKQFVKAGVSLKGSHKEHQFDVAVANGRPYLAAHGISFEVHTPESIQAAIAWINIEVKQVDRLFTLVILTLPPSDVPDYKVL
ncbi:hypothetical protein [Altericista sp. CCNU0014]|uniref:hypothetical protein n=1 Tax=Altericista sp. CCNU0014 TaxID=3082949 RepID=UPI0038504FB3